MPPLQEGPRPVSWLPMADRPSGSPREAAYNAKRGYLFRALQIVCQEWQTAQQRPRAGRLPTSSKTTDSNPTRLEPQSTQVQDSPPIIATTHYPRYQLRYTSSNAYVIFRTSAPPSPSNAVYSPCPLMRQPEPSSYRLHPIHAVSSYARASLPRRATLKPSNTVFWRQPESTSDSPGIVPRHSNIHPHGARHRQSARLPEWIAQAKDPTPSSKRTSVPQPTSPTMNQAASRRTSIPANVPPHGRFSILPEWIDQAKDPTTYSKVTSIAQPTSTMMNQSAPQHTSFQALVLPHVQFPYLPEWIDQAKDPTTRSVGTPVAQPVSSSVHQTTHEKAGLSWCGQFSRPPEWIDQAKDPTTYSKERTIAPLVSPKIDESTTQQGPHDANNMQTGRSSSPVVARIRSFISRISELFHPRPPTKAAHGSNESPVTSDFTILQPGLSASTGRSTHDCGSPYHVQFQPDVGLHATLPPSWEPSERNPQARAPASYPDGAHRTEPSDHTVGGVVFTAAESSVSRASLHGSTSGTSHASLTTSEEGVRDLTGLVKRGSMTYAGTYSDVYLGKCGTQLVAVKVLKSPSSEGISTVRRRVRREVGTASRFDHPNVLAVYGVIEDNWCPLGGIVTIWCPNGDASKYIHREDVTALARLQMARDVTAGVEYIHGLSVVHGDLKPANILIDDLGNPLICDFGLVRILDTEQPDWVADNTTTVHIGTIRYLSYELSQDPPEPRTMASDIHALGCVIYEFLYLKGPYSTRRGISAGPYVFGDIRNGIPPAYRPASPLFPSISALWGLLEWCWDKEPERRPDVSTFQGCLSPLTEADLQHLYPCHDIVISNV